MSFKKNVLSSYIGQMYMTLIGVVMVPMYVRCMGVEAYGLVGFYSMLQAWFQLLDMGLTPTMSRETARFQGGAVSASSLRNLLRALEGIFIGIALLGCMLMLFGSGFIAGHWLKVQALAIGDVRQAIRFMAVVIALRWICGFYRGAITGFEHLVWLNFFNIGIATARFVLVVPVLLLLGPTPRVFFAYQAFVAVVETVVLVGMTYRLMPANSPGLKTSWRWKPVQKVITFSMGVALTGSVWVLVTQTDKLLLSKFLPLQSYALFTMAVLVSNGITMLSVPISSALMPRMTRLNSEQDEQGMIHIYRRATQLVAILVIPVGIVMAFFAREILWVWTGNPDIANRAAPILRLYAIGNIFLAFSSFPYYLQFAKGNLKFHLIGNGLFVSALIPTIIGLTLKFGAIGSGSAWLGSNMAYFFLWVPVIHARFAPGLNLGWVTKDIGAIALPVFGAAVVMKLCLLLPVSRIHQLIFIMSCSAVLLGIGAVSATTVRDVARGLLNGRLSRRIR